jgi:hypothetical protein
MDARVKPAHHKCAHSAALTGGSAIDPGEVEFGGAVVGIEADHVENDVNSPPAVLTQTFRMPPSREGCESKNARRATRFFHQLQQR